MALRLLSGICVGLLSVASASWAITPGPNGQETEATLKARIDQAQLVIAGRVNAVRPPTGRIGSEHDPQWSEADIEVDEVLKGTAGRTITIVYPASRDVMWYRIPKPRVGQRGVWILSSGLPEAPPKEIGIADPKDFQATSQLSRVKALLGL